MLPPQPGRPPTAVAMSATGAQPVTMVAPNGATVQVMPQNQSSATAAGANPAVVQVAMAPYGAQQQGMWPGYGNAPGGYGFDPSGYQYR